MLGIFPLFKSQPLSRALIKVLFHTTHEYVTCITGEHKLTNPKRPLEARAGGTSAHPMSFTSMPVGTTDGFLFEERGKERSPL